jgi:hypothetical protein
VLRAEASGLLRCYRAQQKQIIIGGGGESKSTSLPGHGLLIAGARRTERERCRTNKKSKHGARERRRRWTNLVQSDDVGVLEQLERGDLPPYLHTHAPRRRRRAGKRRTAACQSSVSRSRTGRAGDDGARTQ